MSKNKLTAEQNILLTKHFDEYRKYICKLITNIYKKSFLNPDNIGDSWRETFDCTPEYIEYVKMNTCIFLKFLVDDVPEFRNQDFLTKFIREISKFLSVYTWRFESKTKISEFEKQSKQHKHYLIWFNELFTTHKALKNSLRRYEQKNTAQQQPEKRQRKRIGQPVEMAVEIKRISEIPQEELDKKIKKRRKKIKCQAIREKHKQQKQQLEQAVMIQISVNTL